MNRRVYITQFGGWWSASPEAFLRLADRLSAPGGDSYNFDTEAGFTPLTRRPACIVKDADEGRYYPDGDTLLFRPLDADEQDWAAFADEVRHHYKLPGGSHA